MVKTHRFTLETLDHIGIHVRDCEKVMKVWKQMFGIGPCETGDVHL